MTYLLDAAEDMIQLERHKQFFRIGSLYENDVNFRMSAGARERERERERIKVHSEHLDVSRTKNKRRRKVTNIEQTFRKEFQNPTDWNLIDRV